MSRYVLTSGTFYLNTHDVARLRKVGHVCIPDLVPVPGQAVVKLDDDLTPTVIGIVTKGSNMRHVIQAHDTYKVHRNRLVRINDLVTMQHISSRTGRTQQSLANWKRHKSFPRRVRMFGRVPVWYWPDIKAWIISRGLLVKLPPVSERSSPTAPMITTKPPVDYKRGTKPKRRVSRHANANKR